MERQKRYMYYFEKGRGNNVPFARHTERRKGEMVEPPGGGPRWTLFVQKNFDRFWERECVCVRVWWKGHLHVFHETVVQSGHFDGRFVLREVFCL